MQSNRIGCLVNVRGCFAVLPLSSRGGVVTGTVIDWDRQARDGTD